MHAVLNCLGKVGIGGYGLEIVDVDVGVVCAEAAERRGARKYGFLGSRYGIEAGEVGNGVDAEAPFVAEYFILHAVVCAGSHHTYAVVRRHGAACALCRVAVGRFARFHAFHLGGAAEARERLLQVLEFEFARSLLGHKFAYARTVGFLGVEAHVLDVYEAAPALRAQNAALQKSLDIKSKDAADLFEQLQRTERRGRGKDSAFRMVSDMIAAYPDEFDELLKKSRAIKSPSHPANNKSKDSSWSK